MIPLLLASLVLQAPPATPTPEAPPVARIAVIGASVSAGFGLDLELGAKATLVDFLEGALLAPHEPVAGFGSSLFFDAPVPIGTKQVERALATSPTLVVAADYLFWFGYGIPRPGETRLERLEAGIALLERFECPVLASDFPDMSPALKGSSPLYLGKPLLNRRQVPSPEQLQQLNRRVREWARSRPDVHLFEMSRFVEALSDEEPITIRGNAIAAEAKAKLLQTDLLHPTLQGGCLFTVLVFDTLVREGVVTAESIAWDVAALEKSVWEATEPQREKKRQRAERKAERERELERRRREKEEREKKGKGGGMLVPAPAGR